MMHSPITQDQLKAWSDAWAANDSLQVAAMALSKSPLSSVSWISAETARMRQKFSLEIPTLPVADQQHSGRCWLFAAANVVREKIAKDLNLASFELSQSYLAFWDKFERCNYFLQAMLDTANLPTDDRTVSFLLSTGVHDGGQWDMFTNIVNKYGLVPKDVYDETYQSSNTREMNYLLNRCLKAGAARLRRMAADGAGEQALDTVRRELLGAIYGFLCSCYGEPPAKFDFEYVDKDRAYHLEQGLTPLSFRDRYVGDDLANTVSIINAPTKDKPFNACYSIRYLGNVVGGHEVRHLNLPMDAFKQAVIAQLKDGRVVWFGSDVGHYGEREMGIWDDRLFNSTRLTGLPLSISKEDALDYGFSAMNHAMVLTGVHLQNGRPVRWKIENSWGDGKGEKGYYICSDSWFDQYVYQAAVDKKYLGEAAALCDGEARMLDPWDPMGTLAD